MKHHFNWRIGLGVILVLAAIVLLLYPRIVSEQRVPVRQTTEIRPNSDTDDSAVRQAVKSDMP